MPQTQFLRYVENAPYAVEADFTFQHPENGKQRNKLKWKHFEEEDKPFRRFV